MKVMKFGGTSVGSPERMKGVASLVTESGEPTFIVLSAMSGTTNSLVEISDYLYKKNPEGANEVINNLEKKYMQHVEELYSTEEMKNTTREFLQGEFNYLRSFTKDLFTSFEEKSIVAQGEMMSTNMVVNYLKEQGVKAVLLNALDFMRTDKNAEPDPQYIKEKLAAIMEQNQGYQIYITQGFICRNAYGEVDNLQRGGSDYTASLIGAALPAEEIQIWTDIDGMHNNDPRVVEHTEAVRQLNFEEAAELAYFGAKILHPTCVQPAKYAGIPVRLKNTMDPKADGTIIDNVIVRGKIKAVAFHYFQSNIASQSPSKDRHADPQEPEVAGAAPLTFDLDLGIHAPDVGQLLGRHTFQHRHALAPTPPFAVDKITDDPESNAHPHNLFEDFFYLISDTHNIIVL
mgnify:CR=1 FL=1